MTSQTPATGLSDVYLTLSVIHRGVHTQASNWWIWTTSVDVVEVKHITSIIRSYGSGVGLGFKGRALNLNTPDESNDQIIFVLLS